MATFAGSSVSVRSPACFSQATTRISGLKSVSLSFQKRSFPSTAPLRLRVSCVAKPEEAKAEEAKPVQGKPVQAKAEEGKPVQAKPVQAKAEEGKPVQASPETVEMVCDIVRKQLALPAESAVTGESKFAALGADSLDTVEIVMGLEEAFGISVEEESAQAIATVQDAADMIEMLIAKK